MSVSSSAMAAYLPMLVTGTTGVAGLSAFRYFRRRYPGQIVGIRPVQATELHGTDIVPLDAADVRGLNELFAARRFRSVLNCVGNCALRACELDPAMARLMNVATAAAIVDNATRHGCRLVHLSSDLVFSGNRPGGYVETDPVDPVTMYGKTMAEAERLIVAADPRAALLRIALPMGPSLSKHAGAIDWISSRFRKGRPATLYFDEVRSCTYVDDLNRVCAEFLVGGQSGIYHVGGPRPMTLYQIGQVVNRVGGFASELLHGCPRQAAGPMPPRAGNVAMNSDKLLAALGRNPFRPWPADPELMPTDRDWHHRRPADEPRSLQRICQVLYRQGNDPEHSEALML